MSEYEYKQLLGYKRSKKNKRVNTFKLINSTAPDSVDWRNNNAVTAVKN